MKKRLVAAGALLALAGGLYAWRQRAASSPSTATASPAPGAAISGGRPVTAGQRLGPAPADPSAKAPATPRGATAFREYTDDYIDLNPELTQEHMRREGITLEETKELTYFALLSLESQDWGAVETLTGHPIEEEARRQSNVAMMQCSREMQTELKAHVAKGDPVEARWETIDRIEEKCLAQYYHLTGMNDELLDQLLLLSVNSKHVEMTAQGAIGDTPPPVPSGAGSGGGWVKRDPRHPEAPPEPVAAPPELDVEVPDGGQAPPSAPPSP